MKHSLIGLTLLLAGCSSPEPASVGAPTVSLPGPALGAPFTGRVVLAEPVPGASIEVRSLAGDLLHRTVTDSAGTFMLPAAPPDFRVLAHVPQGPSLALEVRGGPQGWLWVSPVTTLVSRAMQGQPGESLAEATARIKVGLGIPPSTDIGSGLGDTYRSTFSWTQFTADAGPRPLDEWLDQVAARLRRGEQLSFRRPDPYAAIHRALGQVQTDQVSAVRGKFATLDGFGMGGILAGLVSNTITGTVDAALGKTLGDKTEKAAYQTITTDLDTILSDLTNIQNALDQLEGEIDQVQQVLQDDVTSQTLRTQYTTLNAATSRIKAQSAAYLKMLQALNQANLPQGQQVFAPPSQVTSFANSLILYNTGLSNTLASDIQTLRDYLQGQGVIPSTLLLNNSCTVFSRYGINSSGTNMFADVRSNQVNADCTKLLDYFRGYQLLAANLAAEYGHLDQTSFALPDSPTSNALPATLQTARQQVNKISQDLVIEQQLVPPPTIGAATESFSQDSIDNVFVDLTTDTMWYTVMWPQSVNGGPNVRIPADQFSPAPLASFSLGPWGAGEWRLPTVQEGLRLRELVLALSPNDVNGGLEKLGFTHVPGTNDVYLICVGNSDDPAEPIQAGDAVAPVFLELNEGVVNGQGAYFLGTQTPCFVAVRTCPGTAGSNPSYANPPAATETTENPGTLLAVSYPTSLAVGVLSGQQLGTQATLTSSGLRFAFDPIRGATGGYTVQQLVSTTSVLDWSSLVNWLSPTTLNAVVSNVAGQEGTLFWTQATAGSGNVQASLYTAADANFAPSTQVTASLGPSQLPGTPSAPTLQSLLVTPQNRALTAPNTSLRLFATGFYSDGTQRDLTTSPTTWTVSPPAPVGTSSPSSLPARIVVGAETVLTLPTPPGAYNYVVTATVGGLKATATVQGEY